MKVMLDQARCQGHGQCEEAAPEVFRVGDDGIAVVLAPQPARALREKIQAACERCPERAITLDATPDERGV